MRDTGDQKALPRSAPILGSGHGFAALKDEFARLIGDSLDEQPRADELFDWRYDFASSGQVAMFRSAFSRGCSIKLTIRIDQILWLAPERGASRAHVKGRVVTATPGQALLLQSRHLDRLDAVAADGEHAGVALAMEEAVFREILAELTDLPAAPDLGLPPLVDRTTGPGRVLDGLVGALVAGLSDEAPLLSCPAASALTLEAIARLTFQTLPHGASERLKRPRAAILPRQVRRAIDFMVANLQQPVTIHQLAAAGHTSVRSLEQAFKQFLQITPMAHLRKLRLEAVRTEIRRQGCAANVGDIARDHGFVHLGRFAAYYRTEFGELPSETAAAVRAASSSRC